MNPMLHLLPKGSKVFQLKYSCCDNEIGHVVDPTILYYIGPWRFLDI